MKMIYVLLGTKIESCLYYVYIDHFARAGEHNNTIIIIQ